MANRAVDSSRIVIADGAAPAALLRRRRRGAALRPRRRAPAHRPARGEPAAAPPGGRARRDARRPLDAPRGADGGRAALPARGARDARRGPAGEGRGRRAGGAGRDTAPRHERRAGRPAAAAARRAARPRAGADGRARPPARGRAPAPGRRGHARRGPHPRGRVARRPAARAGVDRRARARAARRAPARRGRRGRRGPARGAARVPVRLPERAANPPLVDLVVAACRAAGFEPRIAPAMGDQEMLAAIAAGPPTWTAYYAVQAEGLAAAAPGVVFRAPEPALAMPTLLAMPREPGPRAALLDALLHACRRSRRIGRPCRSRATTCPLELLTVGPGRHVWPRWPSGGRQGRGRGARVSRTTACPGSSPSATSCAPWPTAWDDATRVSRPHDREPRDARRRRPPPSTPRSS